MLQPELKEYLFETKIGEGAFSTVFKVKKISTGEYFAAKQLTRCFESAEEVEEYEELKALLKLQFHTNVTQLIDHVYDAKISKLTLIFNLMDHSLYDYIKDRKKKLSEARCKNYLFQLGHGLFYLHHNGIFHRDLKPENCLLRIDPVLAKSNPLKAELVQISDLGSAARFDIPQPRSVYVSTRWYRAPECIITKGLYGSKMDIWALGCCFYEIFTLTPLFPGENEIDQLDRIHSVVGSPCQQLMDRFGNPPLDFEFPRRSSVNMHTFVPMLSLYGVDILKKTLAYHPENRISAKKLLQHPYFDDLKQRVSGDAITTRLLYTKSDSSTSSLLRKSQAIANQGKSSGKCSKSSSFSSTCSKHSVKSQLQIQQEKLNYELERNWNNPKRNFIKNAKSSVISADKA